MVYRKGELTKRIVLRNWPHHVLTLMPANGFGQMLNRMHDFCRQFDHQTTSAYGPGKPEGCYWCFKSEADAEAFKAWYASQ